MADFPLKKYIFLPIEKMINGFDALKNRQQSKQQRFSSGEGHSSVLRTVVLFKVFFWNLMVLNEENRTQV